MIRRIFRTNREYQNPCGPAPKGQGEAGCSYPLEITLRFRRCATPIVSSLISVSLLKHCGHQGHISNVMIFWLSRFVGQNGTQNRDDLCARTFLSEGRLPLPLHLSSRSPIQLTELDLVQLRPVPRPPQPQMTTLLRRNSRRFSNDRLMTRSWRSSTSSWIPI